jgi:hypothetical protein
MQGNSGMSHENTLDGPLDIFQPLPEVVLRINMLSDHHHRFTERLIAE